MSDKVSNQNQIQQRIAANLAYYRRQSGMTQSELAERINYSDKSISKWERAGGLPDICVLISLSELYGVTVNDLISENTPIPPYDPKLHEKSRIVLLVQLVALVWLAATVVFTVWLLFFTEKAGAWQTFVVAVPCSAAVFVAAAQVWWGRVMKLVSISVLSWTIAACVFFFMRGFNFAYLLFIVCAVAQATVLLWFLRAHLTDKARRQHDTIAQ